MFRYGVMLLLVLTTLCGASFGCSCLGFSRPCERLRADAVFVGRVVDTQPAQHVRGPGFSMRFAVDESLRGAVGAEVVVETGSGGGDCGTPHPPGGRFLIFAYKDQDGRLWTGLCSGNIALKGAPGDDQVVQSFRDLVKPNSGSIFGRVTLSKPVWQNGYIGDGSEPKPVEGMVLSAKSEEFNVSTRTDRDGSYKFSELPNGKYRVVAEGQSGTDYNREHGMLYEAVVSDGACANISFKLQPNTRIRGHVTLLPGVDPGSIQVVAVPVRNQSTGKGAFVKEDRFDLWPLPPGDYLVGVNITGSTRKDVPFPPTYYPGVTNKEAAEIVHLEEGDVKELELHLPRKFD